MSRETLSTCNTARRVLAAFEVAIREAVAALDQPVGVQAQSSVRNPVIPDKFNGQQNGLKASKFPQVNRPQGRV